MSLIVGIDNDKLEFLATDDGQLVVTVKNLTEAIVDREVFLQAYITHCKDCRLWKTEDCYMCNSCKVGTTLMTETDFCSRAERKEKYVTLHHEDIHFNSEEDEKAFYEALAERKEE